MEQRPIQIAAGPHLLDGMLEVPPQAAGIVLFAHGSGSGRFSPRNQFVARALRESRLATLLMDLLTPEEDAVDQITRRLRFDIPMLGDRVVRCIDWVSSDPACGSLPVGLFGASTGAAAALLAAAARPRVRAVVSRGGRPDLAAPALPNVRAPTLFIVGERDTDVLALNRDAMQQLAGARELAIVPNATHLFEESGALEQVAHLAAAWFEQHLTSDGGSRPVP